RQDIEVGSPDFLRASEAITGAPISEGNDVELLINGDEIFPAFLETVRGAEKMNRELVARMKSSGVRVVYFRPPKPYALRRLANRTHRRLLVADGRIAMTGGVGIAAEWTGNAEDPDHWRDTH